MIQSIPAKHATPIAANHHIGPSIIPIRAEYHISANPSFLFDSKKTLMNTKKPRMMPEMAKINKYLSILIRYIIKITGKIRIKASLGTLPFFMSNSEIITENKVKSTFSMTINIIFISIKYELNRIQVRY